MKTAYFPRLAADGMRKNRRLYSPYLMMCALMIAVHYIVGYLYVSPLVNAMKGGSSLKEVLWFGRFVIAVFAAIFLLYGNSFLIRRRKREFGLYRVLGMDRSGIRKVALLETLYTEAIAMLFGLGAGIALSKLAETVLMRLVRTAPDMRFSVPTAPLLETTVLFTAIFLLLLFNTLIRVRFVTETELLKSEAEGDKPPKAHLLPGLIGAFLLAGAYCVAVKIDQPIAAMLWFFLAVIAVIVATYLLFVSGSVHILSRMQRSKSYYYKAEHFLSVSSMRYRMKRNGAGLASICILMTMVLVTLGSTACLYFGKDAALAARYPRDVCTAIVRSGYDPADAENLGRLTERIAVALPADAVKPGTAQTYTEYCVSGYLLSGKPEIDVNYLKDAGYVDYDRVAEVHFLSAGDYNRLSGKDVVPAPGEALVHAVRTDDVGETLTVGGISVKVRERIGADAGLFPETASVCPNLYVIVDDARRYAEALSGAVDYNGTPMLLLRWYYRFDTQYTGEDAAALTDAVLSVWNSEKSAFDPAGEQPSFSCVEHEAMRADFYTSFGGLFFVGILLSAVFTLAATLIIYFKQVSEGYEDSARFGIMRKVGLSAELIRKSVRGQMRTVFLLPLGAAVVHLAFAFPMLSKMLRLFGVTDTRLLILTCGGSVLLCMAVYLVICRFTSDVYTAIVGGTERGNER
ncbi:MAG: ABC transporter permease [Clostridia bacterium]|nr:ABC transporter permease [Clostridia bacterium]